jgi:disulfide oxidoreductase YuzD
MPKADVESKYFECCICLENKHTIKQPCYKQEHRICTSCIFKIIRSIPISKEKPKICCQYPYEECKVEYSDIFVKSVLKDRYDIYRFAKDSYMYPDYMIEYCPGCENLLVFDEDLEYNHVYECLYCFKSYCYTCGMKSDKKEGLCKNCKRFDNINPYANNYFFYKNVLNRKNQADYFCINKDINVLDACGQIVEKLKTGSVNCPCCITPLQRSEQCNALSHCHIEICFWCGKFSKIGQTLYDHWSARGKGCIRWNSDPGMNNYLPSYSCVEGVCYSHRIGDCTDEAHKKGKEFYYEFKKKLFVYHALKSLLPRIRYEVISYLPLEYRKYLPKYITFDEMDCIQWDGYDWFIAKTEIE